MQQPGYFKPDKETIDDLEVETPDGPRYSKNRGLFLARQLVPDWLETRTRPGANAAETREPAKSEAEKVKAYSTFEGRPLSEKEVRHVNTLDKLGQSYESRIQLSRTLDEYFHEFLEDEALRKRNTDQTISRFIARDWWRLENDGRASVPGADKKAHDKSKQEKSTKERNDGPVDAYEARAQQPERVQVPNDQCSDKGKGTGESVIPADVESQTTTGRHGEFNQGKKSIMTRFWQLVLGHSTSRTTDHREGGTERDTVEQHITSATKLTRGTGDQSPGVKGTVSRVPELKNDKGTRQQVLVVPQLWLWSCGSMSPELTTQVENTIG